MTFMIRSFTCPAPGAGIPVSYMRRSGFCLVNGKAWQGKIPERSEDDFSLSNQPVRAALHMTRQKTIFAGRSWNILCVNCG